MTIAAKDKSSINWVKDELKKRFKLRDLGQTSYSLAVSITRDRSQRSILLSQRHYILLTLLLQHLLSFLIHLFSTPFFII